jgi:hypothetical protein
MNGDGLPKIVEYPSGTDGMWIDSNISFSIILIILYNVMCYLSFIGWKIERNIDSNI